MSHLTSLLTCKCSCNNPFTTFLPPFSELFVILSLLAMGTSEDAKKGFLWVQTTVFVCWFTSFKVQNQKASWINNPSLVLQAGTRIINAATAIPRNWASFYIGHFVSDLMKVPILSRRAVLSCFSLPVSKALWVPKNCVSSHSYCYCVKRIIVNMRTEYEPKSLSVHIVATLWACVVVISLCCKSDLWSYYSNIGYVCLYHCCIYYSLVAMLASSWWCGLKNTWNFNVFQRVYISNSVAVIVIIIIIIIITPSYGD
jgi:hypothetical protein